MAIFDDLKSKHILCEGLDDGEIETIAGLVDTFNYSKNDPVFREKEPTSGIYMINSGEVEITKKLPVDIKSKLLISLRNIQHCCEIRKTPYGWRQIFATLVDGHFFGELSVIEDKTQHGADADTTEDSELFLLRKESFNLLETKHPLIIAKILRTIAKISSINVRHLDRQLLKVLVGY